MPELTYQSVPSNSSLLKILMFKQLFQTPIKNPLKAKEILGSHLVSTYDSYSICTCQVDQEEFVFNLVDFFFLAVL